jgi:hypothetical protein
LLKDDGDDYGGEKEDVIDVTLIYAVVTTTGQDAGNLSSYDGRGVDILVSIPLKVSGDIKVLDTENGESGETGDDEDA